MTAYEVRISDWSSDVCSSDLDAAITRAEIPRSSSQAVLFKLKRRADQAPILAAIDPYRGRIVRDGGLSAWPVEWLFVVHEQLLSGPAGEYIIGIEGIVLFAMSATGLRSEGHPSELQSL